MKEREKIIRQRKSRRKLLLLYSKLEFSHFLVHNLFSCLLITSNHTSQPVVNLRKFFYFRYILLTARQVASRLYCAPFNDAMCWYFSKFNYKLILIDLVYLNFNESPPTSVRLELILLFQLNFCSLSCFRKIIIFHKLPYFNTKVTNYNY